jgi:LysR family transcriptional regulator, regulator for metE and metH
MLDAPYGEGQEIREVLEIRHLRSLMALADAGTVSAAADRVCLSQSAVSHQIRALEAHYRTPIVKRQGQSVVLTPAGERLVKLARTVMEDLQAAERDLARLKERPSGSLRIALECHTCFDWLMPIMDVYRHHWPEVEMDLVSGFHPHPLTLLVDGKADLIVGSERTERRGVVFRSMFRFEVLAVLPTDHPLKAKRYLTAADFEGETLITYPVPDSRIDVIRRVLKPAKIGFKQRTAELTIAILQLVASHRGIAALPNWGIRKHIDLDYVIARRIGKNGLWSDLYAASTIELDKQAFIQDFLETARRTCFATLDGIVSIP